MKLKDRTKFTSDFFNNIDFDLSTIIVQRLLSSPGLMVLSTSKELVSIL